MLATDTKLVDMGKFKPQRVDLQIQTGKIQFTHVFSHPKQHTDSSPSPSSYFLLVLCFVCCIAYYCTT